MASETTTQHTPGRWTATLTRTQVGIAWKIAPIGACLYVDTRGGVCNPNMSEEEASANAHLIAAAPDLFTALRGLLDATTTDPEDCKSHVHHASMVEHAQEAARAILRDAEEAK